MYSMQISIKLRNKLDRFSLNDSEMMKLGKDNRFMKIKNRRWFP